MLLALLTVIITATSFPSPWVQVARVARRRSIEGLSASYLLIGFAASVVWVTYGISASIGLQILLNSSSAIAGLVVLGIALRARAIDPVRLVLTVALVIASAVTLSRFGITAVGSVAMSMAISARIPQIVKAWKEPGGIAVSIPSFAIAGTCSSSWVIYSAIIGDHVVMGTATFNALFALFVVLRTRQARTPIPELAAA